MERPSTWTILRPPGGISPVSATTWLANGGLGPLDRLQAIERAGVAAHDPAAELGVDPRRQCLRGRV
jgi:hypothetical protein